MKLKINLILLIIIFTTSLFIACSSDSNEFSDVIKLPVKITFIEGETHEFEYDSKNRITKFTAKEGGDTDIYNFIYESTGNRLSKITSRETDTIYFTYLTDSNEVQVTNKIHGSVYTEIFKLNNKGQLVSYGENSENQEFFYSYDSQGRLTKEWYFSGPEEDEQEYGIEYLEYDNKRGMLSQVRTAAWVYFVLGEFEFEHGYFINNMTSQKWIYDGGVINFVYGYDIDDYPTKIYEVEEGSEPKVIATISYKTINY